MIKDRNSEKLKLQHGQRCTGLHAWLDLSVSKEGKHLYKVVTIVSMPPTAEITRGVKVTCSTLWRCSSYTLFFSFSFLQ